MYVRICFLQVFSALIDANQYLVGEKYINEKL
jgi:hypothetical protein